MRMLVDKAAGERRALLPRKKSGEAVAAKVPFEWIKSARFKQPEDSLGYLLWQTAHGWMRLLNSTLVEIGMTHLQFIVIGSATWLMHVGKQPSQAKLAEFCAMDPMLISKVVRMLEKKGSIKRTADTRETRIKLVSLTEEGEAMLIRALPLIERAYDEFFSPLGEKEKDFRESLLRLFHPIKPQ
jgi:DNA-binding MarR family transcriptional regulator